MERATDQPISPETTEPNAVEAPAPDSALNQEDPGTFRDAAEGLEPPTGMPLGPAPAPGMGMLPYREPTEEEKRAGARNSLHQMAQAVGYGVDQLAHADNLPEEARGLAKKARGSLVEAWRLLMAATGSLAPKV